jgi:hypothetical protein
MKKSKHTEMVKRLLATGVASFGLVSLCSCDGSTQTKYGGPDIVEPATVDATTEVTTDSTNDTVDTTSTTVEVVDNTIVTTVDSQMLPQTEYGVPPIIEDEPAETTDESFLMQTKYGIPMDKNIEK